MLSLQQRVSDALFFFRDSLRLSLLLLLCLGLRLLWVDPVSEKTSVDDSPSHEEDNRTFGSLFIVPEGKSLDKSMPLFRIHLRSEDGSCDAEGNYSKESPLFANITQAFLYTIAKTALLFFSSLFS